MQLTIPGEIYICLFQINLLQSRLGSSNTEIFCFTRTLAEVNTLLVIIVSQKGNFKTY